jgi:circadian clock protein KaiC
MTESESDIGSANTRLVSIPLDPTGVPGLDEVLGGGIQRGSLAIIAGPPGGGKTILAHQIAFSAARAGRRTVVLTAFSEPTNKLIVHLRSFTFFDQDRLGQTLEIFSMQRFLKQGLAPSIDDIASVVRTAKAELVVLDGFRGVREIAERPEDVRRFIYDVSNRLNLLGVTLLLTSEANVRDAAFFPEATSADVLLGLTFDTIDARERRALEVLKVRGAAPLTGRHALTIGDEGVTVYPRLEARLARLVVVNRPAGPPRSRIDLSRQSVLSEALSDQGDAEAAGEAPYDRVGTGVLGLDALMDGGLVRGSSTLVVGERGAGKTLLGLQFALQGVRAGETSLFAGFHETAEQLVRKAAPFGWAATLENALEAHILTVLRTPPIELNADVFADNLLTLLDESRARRLVLDEIGEIEYALAASGYIHRFHDFLAALVEALSLRNVTLLLTRQVTAQRRSALEDQLDPNAAITDTLLWLRVQPAAILGARGTRNTQPTTVGRLLSIVQTSLTSYSDAWHPVTIEAPDGIVVRESQGKSP